MQDQRPAQFEFGSCVLDFGTRRLTCSGRDVPLRAKSFDVLACLVAKAGEMVEKDEIFDVVWPGVFVSDHSLTRCVADIRKALGDTNKQIIRTISGRGYQFSAEFEAIPNVDTSHPAISRIWPSAIAALGLIVILASASMVLALLPPTELNNEREIAQRASIVVLPLENLSSDSAQNYFVNGLTDDITTDLSRVSGLFVIARNSAFTYTNQDVDPKQVSRELGVSYVMKGSVRRVGGLLRINVKLIDGRTGGHVWAERYDGALDEVFAFQDSVVANVVSSLHLRLDPGVTARARSTETKDPKAYDAFLEGWTHYLQRTPEDYALAVQFFKTAVKIDPDYSRAYAALASTYWEGWERWWFEQLGFSKWMDPRREAERYLAIALKRPTALAHGVASELRRQEGRYDEMLREARTALQLAPNDPNSYVSLIFALGLYGKHADALAAVDRAMKLDPHYPAFFLYQKGFVLFSLRRYEEAAQFLERALSRNPANHSPNTFLIACYARLGRMDDAKARIEKHPHSPSLDWVQYYFRYQKEEDLAHLINSLKLAGVPEVATEVPAPPKDALSSVH